MNKETKKTEESAVAETRTAIPSVPLPHWKDKPTDRIIMTDEIRMAEDALKKALSDGAEGRGFRPQGSRGPVPCPASADTAGADQGGVHEG